MLIKLLNKYFYMTEESDLTFQRKKEHIELSLTDKVNFKDKTNGFNRYDFEHYAITEVEKDKINFKQQS